MEFLVNITLRWADDLSVEERERISTLERDKAAEYAREGKLLRMWRVPCRFENWGLWKAADATELHDIISSLPAFPWMINVQVHPLARHAVDPIH